MALLTLRFDLRRPDFASASRPDLYAACLEQCGWADDHGFTSIVLSEHHGVEDGYLSAPLAMAGAVLGRTRRTGVSISALLVPLHDPIRLAEDIAVLDLASAGRLTVIAGLGYREGEFEMFGVDRKRRGRIMEEHLRVMKQAWTGEPFEYRGTTVRVTPTPFTKPHPLVMVGGSTEIAARRAARLELPFMPAIGDPELQRLYEEECAEVGFAGGFTVLPMGPGFVHVAEDPERAWELIAPHAMHEAQTYASWQTPGQRSSVTVYADSLEELKASGVYKVVTPDECVALAEELGPMGALVLHPLMGGMDPALGWESLELLASKVLPRLG
jgi:alkanesulfonate monooxygenase SsuD/methylene tetrahydromethanopterin reductase-like flavin-dependent oxidoreductase (luciferase family)